MREASHSVRRQARGVQEATLDPEEEALDRDELLQPSGHKLFTS